jgi:hypothetical protein
VGDVSALVAFVLARADEYESALPHDLGCQSHRLMPPGSPMGMAGKRMTCDCLAVDRGLRQVAAVRQIAERYAEHAEYDREESYEHATGRIVGLGEAMRLLAAVDSGHPDFRAEWDVTATED